MADKVMKRTTNPQDNGKEIMDLRKKVDEYSMLVRRQRIANLISGTSFDGKRNVDETLGYPDDITYQMCLSRFCRQDIARAVIDRPVKATWQGPVGLLESDDDQDTPLEEAWRALVDSIKVKDCFIRADRMTCLGRYGIILLGLDDVKQKQDAAEAVKPGNRKLEYIKPLGEGSAEIIAWDTKANSPRYGQPTAYKVTINDPEHGGVNISLRVHHSRVIHITQDKMESEVYGRPVLESIYNRLEDLKKLVGGSAEMFWKGARPGYGIKMDPEYTMSDKEEENLQEQMDEYEHNLRRFLTMQGGSMEALQAQVSEPTQHVDIQIQMISAVTGIPKRILVGSERGELASTQDSSAWKELVLSRRQEFAELQIVRPFVDRCIALGILPAAKESYNVEWSDLFAPSEKDKAEVGKTRATALKEYASQPGAEMIVPPDAFMRFFLGMTDDQINLMAEMRDQAVQDEQRDIAAVDEPETEEPE